MTSWTNISGATSPNYKPVRSDRGDQLRCVVTAHNSAGSKTIHTPATNNVKKGP